MEILVIDDNKDIAGFIARLLERKGHEVTVKHSVAEVIKNGLEFSHDLIILDLILEDERGEDLLTDLRKRGVNIPILVLSSITNIPKKVDLLRDGADDYMTKPFDNEELLARVDALQRRYLESCLVEEEVYGSVHFYWKQNKIVREGREILLTRKEGQLLKLLVRNKGEVVKSNDLIKKIWNVDPGYHSNILQSLVRHLRKRLDLDFEHKLIHNVHGIGYMLILPEMSRS
ncbi:response regulator transcription factor [Patescibacteria group bacterium]|nr:response regulator transcription factor [Patescibacteria group bacterium]